MRILIILISVKNVLLGGISILWVSALHYQLIVSMLLLLGIAYNVRLDTIRIMQVNANKIIRIARKWVVMDFVSFVVQDSILIMKVDVLHYPMDAFKLYLLVFVAAAKTILS